MAQREKPLLTENEIRSYASSKVLGRGRGLYNEGALEDLTLRNGRVSGICTGSEGDTYSVRALINEAGVRDPHCDCPYGYDGICKHLVALLLTWVHAPESFFVPELESGKTTESSSLFEQLQKVEHDDLAQLVVQLVDAEPKLREMVQHHLSKELSASEIEKVRRSVEGQMGKIAKAEYEVDIKRICREIVLHLRSAENLQTTRPLDAGRLYQVVLAEIISSGCDTFGWIDGEGLVQIAEQCVEALISLLPRVLDQERVIWMKTLCEAYFLDLRKDNTGFAAGVEGVLLKAEDSEWAVHESYLDSLLEEISQPKKKPKRARWDYSGEWEDNLSSYTANFVRSNLLQLKAKRIESRAGERAANEFLAIHGTPQQQIDAHLFARDFDQAIHVAHQLYLGSWNQKLSFANELNQAGEWDKAREWAIQNDLLDWLAEQTASRREPDALEWNIKSFYAHPIASQWLEVLGLVSGAERERIESEMWDYLENNSHTLTQFDIRLREADVIAARELWQQLSSWERESRLEVLLAAVEDSKDKTLFPLWLELAETSIERCNRKGYQVAVAYLVRAKRWLQKIGQGDEWEFHSAALRERFPTLRAFHEELDQAKL